MSTDPLATLSTPHPLGFREVTTAVAAATIGQIRLIDVREPAEFVGPLGHIAGAELVPLATVAEAATAWNRRAPLLVVCRSGGRSGKAAATLAALGFTAYNLQGGMLAWSAEGRPADDVVPA